MSRKDRIESLITAELKPAVTQVEDETYRHNTPKDAESHFKITIISQAFVGKPRIARHRLVNTLLKSEFDTGLHALSLHLYTESEWERVSVPSSPPCRGGKHHEK